MKILKVLGIGLGLLVVVIGGFLAKVAIVGIPHYPTEKIDLKVVSTPERVARGRKWVSMLCAECHMDPKTGKLTGNDMRIDDQFGKIYSYNITQHPKKGIGEWTDGEIAFLLRTGIARDGRYTPPWMAKLPHMADEDLQSVIAFLRSDDPIVQPADVDSIPSKPNFFSKFLTHVAFKPFKYPDHDIAEPSHTDKIAWGKYLAWNTDCWTCHSPDFSKLDAMNPPNTPGFFSGGNSVENATGQAMLTANLTPDPETGIGKWSEDQFVRALREGVRPDNTAIRSPMNAYSALSVEEASAIFAYLKTVPAISHEVPRSATRPAPANSSPGQIAYQKYACFSCHGDTGMASCDLTQNKKSYPSDEDLIAFIKEPSVKVPGSRMPTWKTVIPDDEMKQIVEFVRTLDRSTKN